MEKFYVIYGKLKSNMSRIGKQSITIPKQVQVKSEGQKIMLEGPKGKLSRIFPSLVSVNITDSEITVQKTKDTKLAQSFYGLTRTLISNMVIGVSDGFEKRLAINGVGYRAQMSGNNLVLNMGYSHPVEMIPPPTITIKVENPNSVVVMGVEKELVGEFAAKIRSVRPPEPYKGKGICYENEIIRRKAGKTGK